MQSVLFKEVVVEQGIGAKTLAGEIRAPHQKVPCLFFLVAIPLNCFPEFRWQRVYTNNKPVYHCKFGKRIMFHHVGCGKLPVPVSHFEHITDELRLLRGGTLRCSEVVGYVTETGVWFETRVKEKVDAAYGVNDCRSPYLHSTIKKWNAPLPRHLSNKFLTQLLILFVKILVAKSRGHLNQLLHLLPDNGFIFHPQHPFLINTPTLYISHTHKQLYKTFEANQIRDRMRLGVKTTYQFSLLICGTAKTTNSDSISNPKD